MKIEDYLPKYIKYNPDNGYLKHTTGSRMSLMDYVASNSILELETNIVFNDNGSCIFSVDYFHYEMANVPTINLYNEYCDNDFDNVLFKCLQNFNNRIGNIYDFVDIYRRRNLILKDLICY